jgi:hypothetical protein
MVRMKKKKEREKRNLRKKKLGRNLCIKVSGEKDVVWFNISMNHDWVIGVETKKTSR